MSTITERNARPLAADAVRVRVLGVPAERVDVDGDPADAVRSPAAPMTQILQEG